MDFSDYAKRCARFCQDFWSHYEDGDRQYIEDALAQFSYVEWLEWRASHAEAVEQLAVSPPADQKTRLACASATDRILLLAAAHQYLYEALDVIEAIESHYDETLTTREMLMRLQQMRDDIDEANNSHWPWGPMHRYKTSAD